MIIPIFLPHGGCPERCTFCDQRVSGGKAVPLSTLQKTIEQHLSTLKSKKAKTSPDPAKFSKNKTELAFYGGTFTAMPKNTQLRYLNAVEPYLANNHIQEVRVSTRPDAIDFDWLKFLKKYSLKTVELGVQSFDPMVLSALGRTHSIDSVRQAVDILRSLNLNLGIHVMIGCPLEKLDNDIKILENLNNLHPDFVRIHPILVIKGTPLENLYRSGEFQPIDLEEAINRAAFLCEKLEERGISVIRMGLQPNEILKDSIVSGPYHPAFGDLVRSRMMRNYLSQCIQGVGNKGSVFITTNAQKRSLVSGHKQENLLWLKEKFKLTSIHINVVKAHNVRKDKNNPVTVSSMPMRAT